MLNSDKEVLNSDSFDLPLPSLASPSRPDVNLDLGGGFGYVDPGNTGLSIDQLSHLHGAARTGFQAAPEMVSGAELNANKRYPLYERNVDLENIYGLQQSWYSSLGNGIAKAGITAVGTFANSFTNLPNIIASIKNGDMKDLSGNPDGLEGSVDNFLKNSEDILPNYMTRKEKEHPYLAIIPGATGSANFWGNMVIKNLGFTAGAIAGAVVQDAAVGMVTEGIGEIPLVGLQIGKASLWLNKILAGTNDLEKTLEIGQGLGKTGQQLLNVKKLGEIAAYTKVTNGIRYGLGVVGSAQTEAATESRDSFTTIRKTLTDQYKIDHFGEEPTAEAIDEINNYATNAMNTRFGVNMALLTVSNAIQFDSLFKSFTTAQKGLTSALTKKLEDTGKIGLVEGSLDVFEKKVAPTFIGKAWDVVKPKLGNVISEGIYEEGGQYAAEKGVYDYYTRKYKDPSVRSNAKNWNTLNEVINSTSTGLAEQFQTSEGIQNMIVGAISALVSGGIMGKIDSVKGQGKDARLQSSINVLNNYGVTGIIKDKYTDTLQSMAIAKEMESAVKNKDVYQYKNLQNQMFFGFVNSRLSSDMHDITIEQLEMLKDLPKEEFEKTFGMNFEESNKNTVTDYVDGLIAEANNIKRTSDSINSTFKNPFTRNDNPETPEQAQETDMFHTFNEWKTNLAFYASTSRNSESRLNSIQQELYKINNLLDRDTVSKLVSPDGLRGLSQSYEEQAKALSETITDLTAPADKARIKAQVKALRTASEKANMAIADPTLKLYDDLLNFELNNQDGTKGKVISPEFINDIINYGVDAERLNIKKRRASEDYDNLSTKEGYDKFFNQAQEIKDTPIPTAEEAEEEEAKGPTFVNKAKEVESVEVGREYQIPKTKKAKVKKLADDRFEVTAADGTKTFYPSAEKAKEAADELNSDLAELSNVKVIATNEDGTIKVEDLSGNIQNINPSLLKGYEKVETEQEKLQKFAEQVEKQQDEIEKKSGEIGTQDNPVDEDLFAAEQASQPWEGKLKDASIIFLATTGAFEGAKDAVTRPHETRSREFLNNIKNFANQKNIKTILVPSSNEESLGLKGLSELSSGELNTDAQQGLLSAVYVVQEKGKTYFVDSKGQAIKDANGKKVEVTQQVDLQQVVFSTMPLAELESTDTKGKKTKRYRASQKAEAEAQRVAWEKKRSDIFLSAPGTFKAYNFSISKGIPKQVAGEKNHVGNNLVPENRISTQENLIVISTTGVISHNGENINYPKGRPVIQYADTIQFANNNKFDAMQAGAIYKVLVAMANDIKQQADANKPIIIDSDYATYLQNVLYWKKGKKTTNNQMHIATSTMSLYLGGTEYDLTALGTNEVGEKIITQLANTFHNINRTSLDSDNFHTPFVEYYLNDVQDLDTREWTNYQTYLLSSKLPDGQNRSSLHTPIFTTVSKPTEAVPYNFENKYAILEGMELDVQRPVVVVAPTVIAPVVEEVTTTPEGFEYNGEKVNTYNSPDAAGNPRPVQFTAVVLPAREGAPNGFVQASVLSNETTNTVANTVIAEGTNKGKKVVDAVIVPILKKVAEDDGVEFDATKSDEDYVREFFANKISIELTNKLTEQAPAPVAEVVVPEEVVEVIEAPKMKVINQLKLAAEGSKNTEEKENFARLASELEAITSEEEESEWLFDNEGAVEAALNFKKVKSFAKKAKPKGLDNSEYRLIGAGGITRMSPEEIALFKEWHAANVPNIPYEVLENIITTNKGEKAWGVFENGVAKFYKSAARGTEYHEIFEGIFKGMLSDMDQAGLLEEFRTKSGTFVDRASGKTIRYSEATDLQAKERIADDFADFRVGKLPARTLGEKIRNFFRAILEFFKSFINNKSLKNDLFKAIEAGAFKEKVIAPSIITAAPEYRAVEGLTEEQTNKFVQDMTARAAATIFGNGYSLFDITDVDVFGEIKTIYADAEEGEESTLDILGEKAWEELVQKTKDNLLVTFKIGFSDEGEVTLNDEGVNQNDYAREPFSTNWKDSSHFVIKIATGTLPQTIPTNQEDESALELPRVAASAEDGWLQKLVNPSKAFAVIIDKLANTNKVSNMVDKLADLAKYDSDYVRMFTRVGGSRDTLQVNFNEFEYNDWRFFTLFYQTFTKQNPDAVIQYINGENVYLGAADLYTVTAQTKKNWFQNIKTLAKDPKSLIRFSSTKERYLINRADIEKVSIKTAKDKIEFLNKIGVDFTYDVYKKLKTGEKDDQRTKFNTAVNNIHAYIGENAEIASLKGDLLGIDGNLNTLAELLVKVTNPNRDITHFGVDGKRRQSHSQNNALSVLENDFNEANTLEELLQARPELRDIYSKGSQVLKKGGLFFNKEGVRIRKLRVGYAAGTNNANTGNKSTTVKLSKGDRFVQELNQNLAGNYYALIAGDGSTEWFMTMGNNITFMDVNGGKAWKKVYDVFKGYLRDDINLAKSVRPYLKNVGDRSKDLRMFKEILPESLVAKFDELIAENATDEKFEDLIAKNTDTINESVKSFIDNQVKQTKALFIKTGKVLQTKDGIFSFNQLSSSFVESQRDANKALILDKQNLTEEQLENILTYNKMNYVINNIEYHKILFGDPYQFATKVKGEKVILDGPKRFKSFFSPRETLLDTPEFNTFLNQKLNMVGDIELADGEVGKHLFKSYARTFTASDNNVVGSLSNYLKAYADTNESDASSVIMDNTFREVKIKNGQWDYKTAEPWHQWQMAFTRQNIPGYEYKSEVLRKADIALLAKKKPEYTLDIIKPVVTGTMAGKANINLVLDKFSQMPLYYSMVKGTSFESLYLKMQKGGYGYMVVESGRKVGAGELHPLYKDGMFNDDAINNEVNVAWKSYGIQVENSYTEGGGVVTSGSQATKVVTMDLFRNGQAISAKAKEYTDENHRFLDLLQKNGFEEWMRALGIEDGGYYFKMTDPKAVSETLAYELLKREMSDNGKDTIRLNKNGEFMIPFESSPAYKQIKDVIYSMVDKAIVSRKTSGGAYVQAPVTLWENAKAGRSLVQKVGKNWVKISREDYNKLSDDKKKNVRLTSDTLKFYEDAEGKRHCEILLPNWFKKKITNIKKFKTDAELLTYLNSSEEGKQILRGIGFRIPTQAMSSMEVFVVKGFLADEMGKTVIVPSEITTKAGSDFDIDKLNLYLKSIYLDKNNDIRLVEYKGSEEATKDFYGNIFDETLQSKKDDAIESLIAAIQEEDTEESDTAKYQQKLANRIAKLEDEDAQAVERERFVNLMYKKSLENGYYTSMDKLLTLPENFKRLVSPVSDDGLSDLADELNKLMGYNESNIKNRILDANYMTQLRHSLATAKAWVGIAATSITGHSQAQLANLFIDPRRFIRATVFDRGFLGNGSIALKHNTVDVEGNSYVSLAGTTDADNKDYISDGLSGYATSFVDVSKDPYIMDIIRSEKVVSTFMYLRRIGVPKETLVMFMNQPIIQEYLDIVESTGKGLFSAPNIVKAKQKFVTNQAELRDAKVNEANLKSNIKAYYSGAELSVAANAEQHKVLEEFLKYATMAKYVFKFTQATNYDTSKFRSSDGFNRKQTRTRQARESNIISSIDAMFSNTIIGPLEKYMGKAMEAVGEIIKTEKPEFNIITDDLLRNYADADSFVVSDDDYIKIAAKAKLGLIDFVTQVKTGLNSELYSTLVDDATAVATQLEVALKNHPEIQLLHDLQVDSSDRVGGAMTIKLKVNEKNAIAENMYQGMMRELRDNPETNDLYNGLVKVAIFQGAYQTSVSITNIIPIEDYSDIVKPVIDVLVSDQDVAAYGKNYSFQKNNFADDLIVPSVTPHFVESDEFEPINLGEDLVYMYESESFPMDLGLGTNRILLLDPRYNRNEINYDVVKVKRLVEQDGDQIDVFSGMSVVGLMFAARKAQGDLSLRDVMGYQKVRYKDGSPVLDYDDKGVARHVYKMTNLLGDGNRASEYYLDNKPSVFNNGTVKLDNEIDDDLIRKHYADKLGVFDEEVVYSPFEELFVEQPQLPAALTKLITVEALRENKEFLGTVIDFVDEIATDKETPVAMRNVEKGKQILIVEDLLKDKFNSQAWTTPTTQSDGSVATALSTDQFKSFDEFLTFGLLHEKAHEYISKDENETIGQYEDRINQEALTKLADVTKLLPEAEVVKETLDNVDQTNLEGADEPNTCGQ